MEHFVVWEAVSMAWSEVGLAKDDYPRIAAELRTAYPSWAEVNDVILGDVVGSFAPESALLPLAVMPVIGGVLIAPLPDWGYEESYLRERMARWYSAPRWRHYLNPLRLAGYPIAFLLSFVLRQKLKAAFHAAQA